MRQPGPQTGGRVLSRRLKHAQSCPSKHRTFLFSQARLAGRGSWSDVLAIPCHDNAISRPWLGTHHVTYTKASFGGHGRCEGRRWTRPRRPKRDRPVRTVIRDLYGAYIVLTRGGSLACILPASQTRPGDGEACRAMAVRSGRHS